MPPCCSSKRVPAVTCRCEPAPRACSVAATKTLPEAVMVSWLPGSSVRTSAPTSPLKLFAPFGNDCSGFSPVVAVVSILRALSARSQPVTSTCSEICRLSDWAASPESRLALVGVCRLVRVTSRVRPWSVSGRSGALKSPSTVNAWASSESGSLMDASTTRGRPVVLTVVME